MWRSRRCSTTSRCSTRRFSASAHAKRALLDPQGRVFLECAWEALESAGYNPQETGSSVGVFAAQSLSTYLLHNVHPEMTFREFVLAGR